VTEHTFGILWSGAMTEDKVLALLHALPPGLSEAYWHPATARSAALTAAMPTYQHEAELASLVSPQVRAAVAAGNITLTDYGTVA
jgi:predicted glycoside hydrolase/deacetylase ChbG (UPF0249 family)